MSESPLAESIAAHVSHILDIQKQIQEVDNKLADLKLELSNVKEMQNTLQTQLTVAKNILNFCIEKGIDPIQAKLSFDEKEIAQQLDTERSFKQKLFEAGFLENIYDSSLYKQTIRKL